LRGSPPEAPPLPARAEEALAEVFRADDTLLAAEPPRAEADFTPEPRAAVLLPLLPEETFFVAVFLAAMPFEAALPLDAAPLEAVAFEPAPLVAAPFDAVDFDAVAFFAATPFCAALELVPLRDDEDPPEEAEALDAPFEADDPPPVLRLLPLEGADDFLPAVDFDAAPPRPFEVAIVVVADINWVRK